MSWKDDEGYKYTVGRDLDDTYKVWKCCPCCNNTFPIRIGKDKRGFHAVQEALDNYAREHGWTQVG